MDVVSSPDQQGPASSNSMDQHGHNLVMDQHGQKLTMDQHGHKHIMDQHGHKLIMDDHGDKLIAIIDQEVTRCSEAGASLEAKFETINLKEDEQEDDADFDEILHRRKLETPDWGENLRRERLEAPEYNQKVGLLRFFFFFLNKKE